MVSVYYLLINLVVNVGASWSDNIYKVGCCLVCLGINILREDGVISGVKSCRKSVSSVDKSRRAVRKEVGECRRLSLKYFYLNIVFCYISLCGNISLRGVTFDKSGLFKEFKGTAAVC